MVPHVGFLSSKQTWGNGRLKCHVGTFHRCVCAPDRRGIAPQPAFPVGVLYMSPWFVLLLKFIALRFHAARCQQEKY